MPLALSGRPAEAQSIRTIHAAVDAGVTLIDTADAYCRDEDEVGHNERLIAKALRAARDDVIVATKARPHPPRRRVGARRPPRAHPRGLRGVAAARWAPTASTSTSSTAPTRTSPTPSRSARSRSSRTRARSRWVGISNCNVEQLEEALRDRRDRRPSRTSSRSASRRRSAKGEVDACTQRGIAFLPWSPLGGIGKADATGALDGGARGRRDARRLAAAGRAGVAARRSGPTVIPIPGASRPESITDSARAAELELSDEEVAAISRAATG